MNEFKVGDTVQCISKSIIKADAETYHELNSYNMAVITSISECGTFIRFKNKDSGWYSKDFHPVTNTIYTGNTSSPIAIPNEFVINSNVTNKRQGISFGYDSGINYKQAFRDACAFLSQVDAGAIKRLMKKHPNAFKE